MIDIAILNRQDVLPIDSDSLAEACRRIIAGDGRSAANISLTIVDDEEMQSLNLDHLGHDYPTDVLSFPLSDPGEKLAGEIVASAGEAIANASEYGTLATEELLLYVVHGTLHLIGLGDKTPEQACAMRQAEAYWLAELGVPAQRLQSLVYPDESQAPPSVALPQQGDN